MIIAGSGGGEIAKVLDFGLAKLRENPELNEVTTQGAVIGTPYYMSPEQVLGEEVDGRSDIYSLGAVMFRILTGTYPFTATTPMAMFTKHLTEEPPSAVERAPELNIPLRVSEAVQKCMAKERDARFATIHQLRNTLLSELSALGLPSSDRLVLGAEESGSHDAVVAEGGQLAVAELGASQIATRDEMEQYERMLRRTRYGAWALLAVMIGAGAATVAYALTQPGKGFRGVEREPNNTAADAMVVPLGKTVRGQLGRRNSTGEGDRDFYAFTVPDGPEGVPSFVALRLTALPNFASCALLYKAGFQQQLAQYCVGSSDQSLVISALHVDAGDYFVAVLQDRNPYGGEQPPPIHENVSDDYRLQIRSVTPERGQEVEPNDRPASAMMLVAGDEITGTLAWVGDEDVYCAADADLPLRWGVEDERRGRGTVLEVITSSERTSGPVVRVHAGKSLTYSKRPLPADVASPWRSPVAEPASERCVRVRLTSDPWSEIRGGVPRPNDTPYKVRLETP